MSGGTTRSKSRRCLDPYRGGSLSTFPIHARSLRARAPTLTPCPFAPQARDRHNSSSGAGPAGQRGRDTTGVSRVAQSAGALGTPDAHFPANAADSEQHGTRGARPRPRPPSAALARPVAGVNPDTSHVVIYQKPSKST